MDIFGRQTYPIQSTKKKGNDLGVELDENQLIPLECA